MAANYEERANLAVRMLRVHDSCSDCYARTREAKKAWLFGVYAQEAEELMQAYAKVPDACAFYYDAMHQVGDALWWVDHDEYAARDKLIKFYELLDAAGDTGSIFRRE